VLLAEAGWDIAIVDNLCNSRRAVLERLRALAPKARLELHVLDIRDRAALERVMKKDRPQAVMHFAGLKAIGESVAKPLLYYDNNVGGSAALFQAMAACGVRRLVFSSSATVYGEPERLPLREDHALRPANPYGKTKLVVEHMLADEAAADARFRYAALRYFNPVGAHPSGTIGEDPLGVPNNLFPYLSQVAFGRQPALRIWGRDYPTRDGTGVRDYIHVMDLSRGHLSALTRLQKAKSITVNLGTGQAHSVLEAVAAFERASARKVTLEFRERRAGDVAECYADAGLAARALGWKATLGLDAMCRDAWRWQSRNPQGYI
jgi:UDP-glucose 4-epimerase